MSDCDENSNYVPSRTSPFNAQYKTITVTNMEMLMQCFSLYNEVIKIVFHLEDVYLHRILSVEFSGYCEKEYSRAKIEFNNVVERCAYLLRYTTINSMAMFHHFKYADMLNQIEKMDTVRICCLGGGTGTEIVGICFAISDFLSAKKNKKFLLKLCFTVVDICKELEQLVVALVKKLRKFWKDKLDVRMRFIRANLTKSWPKDVHSAIQKCDILTMAGLLSSLIAYRGNQADKKDLKVLAGVVRRMKMNSWFFFLDYAGGGYYHRVQKFLRKKQYCEQCHSCLHKCHIMTEKMWEKATGSQYLDCSIVEKRMMMNRSPNLSSGVWKITIPMLNSALRGKPSSLTRRRNSGPESSLSDSEF